jgi:hypothetical protein
MAVGFDPVPGGTGKYCDLKPFISVVGAQLSVGLLWQQVRGADLRQITLPGGQPAWLPIQSGSAPLGQRPYNVASLYLPWSGATVHVSLDRTGYAEIFPTIRTRPVTPSTLTLPGNVSSAQILGANGRDRPVNAGPTITDSTVIARALDRLGGLTAAVPNDQACATVNMPTVTVTFSTKAGPVAVVITLSDRCTQATSSLGGRVTVPRGFTNDLWRLLGGSGTVEPAK